MFRRKNPLKEINIFVARVKESLLRYIVIGGGKTGVDALVHLMDSGVSPDSLSWIVSSDCWWWTK